MREFQERMKIIRECPVKVFSAGGGAQSERFWYPYKLQPIHEVKPEAVNECMEFMLDSAIGKEDITNRDVIEKAMEINADFVVPKDYLQDQKRTTESVREFMELWQNSDCRARPLIPLQPPHDEHFDELDEFTHYMVGGVKDADPEEQVEACQSLREKAGTVYIHGLGMGYSLAFIRAVRENPALVDSIDNSSPYHLPRSGRMIRKDCSRVEFSMPRGEDTSTVSAQYIQAMLLQLNYIMSPLCDDEEIDRGYKLDDGQSQLEMTA